jgi:hypothetical protein
MMKNNMFPCFDTYEEIDRCYCCIDEGFCIAKNYR